MAKLSNVVKLTKPQYNTLSSGGEITKNDKTYRYDASTLYLVEEDGKEIACAWEEIKFNNFPDEFDSEYVWTDGINTYFSPNKTTHYIFIKKTNSWSEVSFEFPSDFQEDFSGNGVWTDGENIYFSIYNAQLKLGELHQWEVMHWGDGAFEPRYPQYIWTDGTNIYYSDGSEQKVLDKDSLNWNGIVWYDNLGNVIQPNGSDIWTDCNNNIYYSEGSDGQYILDKPTKIWKEIKFKGLDAPTELHLYGEYTWSDGKHTYASFMDSVGDFLDFCPINYNYILDSKSLTWAPVSFVSAPLPYFNRRYCLWTDGEDIYFYKNEYQYENCLVLVKHTLDIAKQERITLNRKSPGYLEDLIIPNMWEPSWNNSIIVWGNYVWTDGIDIYYSNAYGKKNYKFNKTNKEWEDLGGAFSGDLGFPEDSIYVWSDGITTYYTHNGDTYVWNREDMSWTYNTSSWSFSPDEGSLIWTDGENIYYSYGSNQYQFTGNDWEAIIWRKSDQSAFNFNGNGVWTDGKNCFIEDNNTWYRFDTNSGYSVKAVSFEEPDWGDDGFAPRCVFNDNVNTYYLKVDCSDASKNVFAYRLVKNGGTYFWDKVDYWKFPQDSGWDTYYGGEELWTDGEDIYISACDSDVQLKLHKTELVKSIESLARSISPKKSSGGGGSLDVDQTYNPTSTNAQSGRAVAQAIASAITSALGGNY